MEEIIDTRRWVTLRRIAEHSIVQIQRNKRRYREQYASQVLSIEGSFDRCQRLKSKGKESKNEMILLIRKFITILQQKSNSKADNCSVQGCESCLLDPSTRS